jgi:hypothetical protein
MKHAQTIRGGLHEETRNGAREDDCRKLLERQELQSLPVTWALHFALSIHW